MAGMRVDNKRLDSQSGLDLRIDLIYPCILNGIITPEMRLETLDMDYDGALNSPVSSPWPRQTLRKGGKCSKWQWWYERYQDP